MGLEVEVDNEEEAGEGGDAIGYCLATLVYKYTS